MDTFIRFSVLLTIVLTVLVCWLGIYFVFGGRMYYFTERSTIERPNGVTERMNAEPLFQSDDGAVNEGYFVVSGGIHQRIVLPHDWPGSFGTVELPDELSHLHLPTDFLELVRLTACGNGWVAPLFTHDNAFFEVLFMNYNRVPVERIHVNSKLCKCGA